MNNHTQNQHDLRVMVRGAYDLQKLRIQMGNRIVGMVAGQDENRSQAILWPFCAANKKPPRGGPCARDSGLINDV